MRGSTGRNAVRFLVLVAGWGGVAVGQDTGGVTPLDEVPTQAHIGRELPKPDGSGSFFLDPNRRGRAASVRLVELAWGRLVDVHGLTPDGEVDPRPVFRDFVVNELIQSDGVDHLLQTNPATQLTRLVVLRVPGAPEPYPGAGTFADLVREAESDLPAILPKSDDPLTVPPFSQVPRNATLVARFDDLLDDSAAAAADLLQTVRIATGRPPVLAFEARLTFDGNHGGLAEGAFHSTRVLIDFTISELEAAGTTPPLHVNVLGLPASPSSTRASVSVRIPTQVDAGSGQFAVLTNLRGSSLALRGNGPVDLDVPTRDVVRAMRAGNEHDPSRGFLFDATPPTLLGAFPMVIEDAADAPGGDPGVEFVVDLRFSGPCRLRPLRGDVLATGARFLEVLARGAPPDSAGLVSALLVRSVRAAPAAPGELLGGGLFETTYRPGSALDPACWVAFTPAPGAPPADGVTPSSQVLVRFSEPMWRGSVRPFDTFRVVRGDASTAPQSTSVVVGEVFPGPDLQRFAFVPLLPLAHQQGQATPYHVLLTDVRDLAGNQPDVTLPTVDFTLDPAAPTETNGGVVMTFDHPDELEPFGEQDLRGQYFYDFALGRIHGRPLAEASYPVDRTRPVPSLMIPFAPGVQLPLTPLGCKQQEVWRYADLGWAVQDETKYDLDVVGLNWVPNGPPLSDFFPEFEIALAHAQKLPDEGLEPFLLPRHPLSGLFGAPHPFKDNVLEDPASPQQVVHPRALGYVVDPGDLFAAATGTPMMPYPLNRSGGPPTTYTWRDTAVRAEGGENGAGIPMDVEVGPPLFLEPTAGAVAPAGEVPSIGLPLLMEFRNFPTDLGFGLNAFDVSLAINSSARPTFRVFSAGGVGVGGSVITKNPDLELVPSGGFNPSSTPPGQPSPPDDNLFYLGQLDVVVRVSRAITAWIDTQLAAPDFALPVIEGLEPGGSRVLFEYRGADGFTGPAETGAFDAQELDAYGDVREGTVLFHAGVDAWSSDIHDVDGARYLQLRFSFLSDLETRTESALEAFGIAFEE